MSEAFVMVPSFNHEPFIANCLNSIINQTHPPTKLLVIDDGSKDDSPKIIEEILKECPFDSELIVRENRGLCATLNEGFSLSSGKYFAYLGSDDFWLPGFIEARTALLDTRDTAVLGYGHAFLVNEHGKTFDSTLEYSNSWGKYPDGNAREMLLRGNAPISSTIVYRRSAIENVRWNVNSRLEDYEFYIQLMNLGDFAFDPQVLSAWRDHGYNTSKNKLMMLKEVIAAQDRNMAEFGVDRPTLDEVQTKTRFMFARDLLQHGNKIDAARLAKANWRGAKSTAELITFFVRMLFPMSLVRLRRRMK